MLWYVLALLVILAGAVTGPLLLGWAGIVAALVICGPIAIVLINRGMYPRRAVGRD
jgi:hypothetical protein